MPEILNRTVRQLQFSTEQLTDSDQITFRSVKYLKSISESILFPDILRFSRNIYRNIADLSLINANIYLSAASVDTCYYMCYFDGGKNT